jgi:hypothetical protein
VDLKKNNISKHLRNERRALLTGESRSAGAMILPQALQDATASVATRIRVAIVGFSDLAQGSAITDGTVADEGRRSVRGLLNPTRPSVLTSQSSRVAWVHVLAVLADVHLRAAEKIQDEV